MSEEFKWIAVFSISAMVINSAGIMFVYKYRENVKKVKNYFMCFAAGVLIASPLLMAMPEAIEKNPHAGFAALAGFMFMFFSNKYIKYKTRQPDVAFSVTILIGIGIHSFIDGITYAITFSSSIIVGLLAGTGLMVHEFTEGIITFSAMIKGGITERKAVFWAFLVAGLTTPAGAFIAYPFVSRLSDSVMGLALGCVAGVLIYLSASHLLPETDKDEHEHSYAAFLLGIVLTLFLMFGEM